MTAASPPRPSRDAGFTLVETLAVVGISSIMLGLVVTAYRGYDASTRHKGTAREISSTLRAAQVRAFSEARTYCVRFSSDGKTYQMHRLSCDSGPVAGGPYEVNGHGIRVVNAAFTRPDGTTSADVYFYPRGSASAGRVEVRRDGSSKTYTVTVEGLTARVSSND